MWIANSKQGMQSILNTASFFFRIVDIEINLDKTETIVVKPFKRKFLLVEPLKFGPNKQSLKLLDPSIYTQYLGVWIRADGKNKIVLKMIRSDIEAVYGVIRKKHITKKQLGQKINLKNLSHCKEKGPASVMHHLSLYNLFKIDDIQAKNKITDLLVKLNGNDIAEMATKIRLANLQAQRWSAHRINLIANIMQIMEERGISFKSSGNTHGVSESSKLHEHLIETIIASSATYTKVQNMDGLLMTWMDFTKRYRQSDSGRIPRWFKVLESMIIMDEYRNIDIAQCEALGIHKLDTQIPDDLETLQKDSIYIYIPDSLLPQWKRKRNRNINKWLIARRAAVFVIHEIKASYGIAVDGTLLSTKTEAKTVLLALETVPYKCKLILNTDSKKKIDLTINKVAVHTEVSENEKANKLAKEATAFNTVEWAYNAKDVSYVSFCRKIELDLNIRHFLSQQTGLQVALDWISNNKVQRTLGPLDQEIDWKGTTKI
ncbi:hypothetical protein G9A89_013957 [Geosiphon pyriformis]|nr:hypothetical protein G9A89_013957 [Geosiphon pyriformis]